ncbi:MAG: UDP-3-O-(3-hydroxymyristoyl)glucosamine N-acyltransferase [Bacteroidetes bacterium]|nr:MAG: UDP-3-O-(3-hydroxymyristoyl)glucosamine N-acyltransferase [Bacteroidota bacterium]
MNFTAENIAAFLDGFVEGDKSVEVNNISKIEEGRKGTLSFLANPKYENYIYATNSSIVLINKTFKLQKEVNCTLIRVDDAYKAFASLLEVYQLGKQQQVVGVDKLASIHEGVELGENIYVGEFTVIAKNAQIAKNTKVYPQVYVGQNVKIGENTIIYAGVKIYSDCIIGNDCIIHSGVIIGADGFGFAPQKDDEHKKVPQVGNVIIEDFVEIGANSAVDRATMGSTIIRKGAKLDNFIQVAHNVEIGERTFIAAHTGISGSTKIGKMCLIGGQVGFAGHINIADEVKIGAQAGIANNIKEKGALMQGSPAISLVNFQKSSIVFKTLPDLRREVYNLKRELEELKNNSNK